MEFSINISGLDEAVNLLKKYQEIISSDGLKEYLAEKSIDEINKIANEKLQSSENYNANNKYKITDNGVVIYNEIQSQDGTYISLILEYGSGIYAEYEKFPKHTATYEKTGGVYWLVPVTSGSSLFNTDYEIITLESGDYFKVFAQTPKHIYTDAGKVIESKITTWIEEYIEKEIR